MIMMGRRYVATIQSFGAVDQDLQTRNSNQPAPMLAIAGAAAMHILPTSNTEKELVGVATAVVSTVEHLAAGNLLQACTAVTPVFCPELGRIFAFLESVSKCAVEEASVSTTTPAATITTGNAAAQESKELLQLSSWDSSMDHAVGAVLSGPAERLWGLVQQAKESGVRVAPMQEQSAAQLLQSFEGSKLLALLNDPNLAIANATGAATTTPMLKNFLAQLKQPTAEGQELPMTSAELDDLLANAQLPATTELVSGACETESVAETAVTANIIVATQLQQVAYTAHDRMTKHSNMSSREAFKIALKEHVTLLKNGDVSNSTIASSVDALSKATVVDSNKDMAIIAVPNESGNGITLYGVLSGTRMSTVGTSLRDWAQNFQVSRYFPGSMARGERIVTMMTKAVAKLDNVTGVVYTGHSLGGFQANLAKNTMKEQVGGQQQHIPVTAIITNAGGAGFGSLEGTTVITMQGECLQGTKISPHRTDILVEPLSTDTHLHGIETTCNGLLRMTVAAPPKM